MKIYEVRIETLDAYRGNFTGYATIGYYANEERARAEAEKAYENRNRIIEGKAEVRTIEVIE